MRACWLKWVGRDWSISADYIWLNYSDANRLFNDKSLVTSVGHYFGLDNKIYVDRAISLLEGDLRDELSEALRHYISN